jgi:hypothetical protein
MQSVQLPGVVRVWIDMVYMSKRLPPRRILVEEDESVGVWRLLGEGEGSLGSLGHGEAHFSALRKDQEGVFGKQSHVIFHKFLAGSGRGCSEREAHGENTSIDALRLR